MALEDLRNHPSSTSSRPDSQFYDSTVSSLPKEGSEKPNQISQLTRRNFIKRVGLGILVMLSSGCVSQNPSSSPNATIPSPAQEYRRNDEYEHLVANNEGDGYLKRIVVDYPKFLDDPNINLLYYRYANLLYLIKQLGYTDNPGAPELYVSITNNPLEEPGLVGKTVVERNGIVYVTISLPALRNAENDLLLGDLPLPAQIDCILMNELVNAATGTAVTYTDLGYYPGLDKYITSEVISWQVQAMVTAVLSGGNYDTYLNMLNQLNGSIDWESYGITPPLDLYRYHFSKEVFTFITELYTNQDTVFTTR